MSYAHLLVAEDGNNEKNKIFYQQMQEQIKILPPQLSSLVLR